MNIYRTQIEPETEQEEKLAKILKVENDISQIMEAMDNKSIGYCWESFGENFVLKKRKQKEYIDFVNELFKNESKKKKIFTNRKKRFPKLLKDITKIKNYTTFLQLTEPTEQIELYILMIEEENFKKDIAVIELFDGGERSAIHVFEMSPGLKILFENKKEEMNNNIESVIS